MTRNPFGGTTADEVYGLVSVNSKSVESPTSATVLLYDAQTAGNQILDLQDASGAPITSVTVDSTGGMPVFYGPDGVTQMWASANGGPRRLMVSFVAAANAVSSAQTSATDAAASASAASSSATTAQTAAAQATAPTDAMVAAKVADPTSQTGQALNAAFAGEFTTTVGDGATTTFTVAHNLASTSIVASCLDTGTKEYVYPTFTQLDANRLSVSFASAPTVGQYQITVVG